MADGNVQGPPGAGIPVGKEDVGVALGILRERYLQAVGDSASLEVVGQEVLYTPVPVP